MAYGLLLLRVVAGGEDLLFPLELCRLFADRIPGSSFATIDGAAHSIHMQYPDLFVRQRERSSNRAGHNAAFAQSGKEKDRTEKRAGRDECCASE